MTAAPTVSVVIPCFNLGEYLDDAVSSVLAQTFQDFEILIVDDGSTDDVTRGLLRTYERPKTRIVRTSNRGLSAARNFGVSHTTGNFLCMLDADDCLEPMYMERSIAALREDASIAFVSHWLRTFGDESWEWTPATCETPALLKSNPINGAALFRRELWTATGGFDESMRDGLEDWDFWITATEKGFRGRILPEFLFRYRRRAGSMSRLTIAGDDHRRLQRTLIDKHPASYGEYFPLFLRETEEEANALLTHIQELESERHAWLAPELLSLRDDVAVLERKARAHEERCRVEAQRQRLVEERDALAAGRDQLSAAHRAVVAERDALAHERTRLNTELAQSDSGVRNLQAALTHTQNEVRALRESASWRVTRPFRSGFGWWLRLTGRGQ